MRAACSTHARTRRARTDATGSSSSRVTSGPRRTSSTSRTASSTTPAPTASARVTRVPLLAGTRVEHLDAPETPSSSARRRRPRRSTTSARRFATRSASRWPARRSSRRRLAAGARPSSSSRRRSRSRASLGDPRRAAIEATIEALVALRHPVRAPDAARRGRPRAAAEPPGARARSSRRSFARRFRGRVEVHDVEADDLVEVGTAGNVPLRVNRCLVETDLVLRSVPPRPSATAAPACCSRRAPRPHSGPRAPTPCSRRGVPGLAARRALERALAARSPLLGVSLALNHPVLRGALQGYPHDTESLERLAGSPLGRVFGRLPSPVRLRILRRLPVELTALAVFAGPPSVAHAEALLRSTEARSVSLPEPVDVICVGVPETTPWLPRERPNPVVAATLGLGYALRLWRDRFPVVEGGTAILVHRLRRRFPHPGQLPYRAFFQVARDARRSGRGRERGRARRARARGLPARRCLPPGAALRRLARVRDRHRPARRRPGRRVPRRHRRPLARASSRRTACARRHGDGRGPCRRAAAHGSHALAALRAGARRRGYGRQLAAAQNRSRCTRLVSSPRTAAYRVVRAVVELVRVDLQVVELLLAVAVDSEHVPGVRTPVYSCDGLSNGPASRTMCRAARSTSLLQRRAARRRPRSGAA